MITRYDVYRNGVSLSSLDDNIVITDIQYGAPKIQYKTNRIANMDGMKLLSPYAESCSVIISFMLREYDTVMRQEILQRIINWAMQDGLLRTNDRQWKRLNCVCDAVPGIESVRDWTKEIQIGFTAYNPPYWQEENPVVVTLGGTAGATSGTSNVYIPGNVKKTLATATITAKATITSLTVTAGSTTIGLSFPTSAKFTSGQVVTIDYDDNGILRIRRNDSSILDYRTAASADDLIVKSGDTNTFSFTSTAKAVVQFSVRGWWY